MRGSESRRKFSSLPGIQSKADILHRTTSLRHSDLNEHQSAHHSIQERICPDFKLPLTIWLSSPLGVCHRAGRRPLFSGRRPEGGKIMCAEEDCSGLVEGIAIWLGLSAMLPFHVTGHG